MEVFDNITKIVKDDLSATIEKGSRLSIAAACFSLYAYQELKKQLNDVDGLRFLFTSPTFVTDKAPKEKREFYIPRLGRERSLYGTEFEIKLRNELTQKAIAKECAEWIRKKAVFKSNKTNEAMGGFLNVESVSGSCTYMPINGFTTVDIGCERGNNAYNMITKLDAPASNEFIRVFDSIWNDKKMIEDVTDEVIDGITAAYNENSAEFLYYITLFNIFNEFLEDISEDVLPNEATGFKESHIWQMLYNFQRDAVLAIINKLEKYNGCILADSVGLGKTFSALAVIKYYENRNRLVLVLCPKKLTDNWNTYKSNYLNNPLAADRLRYDVLYHTDLSREHGDSNGLDLGKLNWANYDLVVIDESHNFRNGGEVFGEDARENRYLRLMNRVIRPGVKTKVLMLSATPVNNRFIDLKNQLALAYEGDAIHIDGKLNTSKSIDDIFRNAQKCFNQWSKFDPARRTTTTLLRMLDFDFFEVLDSVTIARSRKHIEKYYNMSEVGRFPERRKPLSLSPNLTDLNAAINYNEIYEELTKLNLSIYTPTNFVFSSRIEKYEDTTTNITRTGREQGIRRLMNINLLKRLESSIHSFRLTMKRIKEQIDAAIAEIDNYDKQSSKVIEAREIVSDTEFDPDDLNTELFAPTRKTRVDLADMDYISWRKELACDADTLELLLLMTSDITPEHDKKLQKLLCIISEKIEQPFNENNRKILVFSAFSDTAEYLFDNVSSFVKEKYALDTALIIGSVDGRTTLPKFRATFNNVLTCFSPISKDKATLMPNSNDCIDVLIATDCISEGQNLQDCDYCVNYDIHWNPVRIIQRFGRIDRIGSKNAVIQLVNFWPDLTLDEYINLKNRVETRMKISVMTSTGDDDPINSEEQGDLEYRKTQLKRLKEEVVDIEEMSGGISIMDLGLNEFRLDLLEYIKENGTLDNVPFGLHAVAPASNGMPPGAIFVLKNVNAGINIGDRNRLHPFYAVYIGNDGTIVCDHLSPKELLDRLRLICRGRAASVKELCVAFNRDTKDGKDMFKYSELLEGAIASIIDLKDQSDLDSFLSGKTVNFASKNINSLDDFELICFIVIREDG